MFKDFKNWESIKPYEFNDTIGGTLRDFDEDFDTLLGKRIPEI